MKKLMLGVSARVRSRSRGLRVHWRCRSRGPGASSGYEYNAHNKMNQLEDDYKQERISRKEYESRKSAVRERIHPLLILPGGFVPRIFVIG